jgi:hypothetical protein
MVEVPYRWRRFRDRPTMLERERELVAALTAVEEEQRGLAERYAELRRELLDLHRQLWPPDRGGPYRRSWREPVPGPSPIPPPLPDAQPLGGRALRKAAVASLRSADRALTLTELHRTLHLAGYRLSSDHPVKQLSDALVHEERRGRVRRVARGTYESVERAATARSA